ncbi:MAG: helix-turn-helix transcriptional regulator [Bacteroidales bacterium]|nr:helix-turn-helix transcriptional regulator [Bacteroidales bacterium]
MKTAEYDKAVVGDFLKDGMDAQGVGVEELAYKSGYSVESVRAWITGRRAMTLDSAIKICDVLDWPLDKLVQRGQFAAAGVA